MGLGTTAHLLSFLKMLWTQFSYKQHKLFVYLKRSTFLVKGN